MIMKRIMAGTLFVISIVIYFQQCWGGEAPPFTYYINLGEYATREEAENHLKPFQDLKMKPLSVVDNGDRWAIHFGDFPYFMDAYLFSEELDARGYTQAEIIQQDNTARRTAFTKVEGPWERVFPLIEKNNQLTSCTLREDDPDVVEIESLMETGTTEQLLQALDDKLAQRKDTDPVKGWLTLRMAYTKYRKSEKSVCRDLFQKVAEGRVKAPPKFRVEAMIRNAHFIHANKKRVQSYRAYREIEEHAVETEQRVEALKQLCGLSMELARDDKGSLSESRVFMENALEQMPPDYRFYPAVIELMHMESWYHEKKYQECIEEGEAFLKKYTGTPRREIATCRLYLGESYFKVDRYEEAKATLEEILTMELRPIDRWRSISDFKKQALVFLTSFAEKSGNKEDFKHWIEVRKRMYPLPK